jgi:hypothetical protein
MPSDPFYRSPLWRSLCAAVARRSRGVCEAPICISPAKVVDHVVSRRNGGPDILDNLRHLCRRHDNAIKENRHGERARGGVMIGCDATGMPTDPAHPWHAAGEGEASAAPGGRSIAAADGAADRHGARTRTKFPEAV